MRGIWCEYFCAINGTVGCLEMSVKAQVRFK